MAGHHRAILLPIVDPGRIDRSERDRRLQRSAVYVERRDSAVEADYRGAVLMYAVGQWNAYFDALIYLKDRKLFPLQLILRSIIIQNNSSRRQSLKLVERQQLAELLKYSLIVVATLPC